MHGSAGRRGWPVDGRRTTRRAPGLTAVRRRLAAVAAALTLVGYVALGRATDERNIRALAKHVGCSVAEARRLYWLSRRLGYGAAYAEVFPGRAIPGVAPFPGQVAGAEDGAAPD
jgi:hypothetical protein